MIHPVFRLAVSQPMLLATHIGAYVNLASQELVISSLAVKRRLAWQLAAALCLAVAATLAGVAVLLWVLLPSVSPNATWAMVCTPLFPATLGLGAAWRSLVPAGLPALSRLKAQLAEDAALLARHPPS